MSLWMTHSHDDQRFRHPGEVVSPELALVDPELATRARDWLPNPGEKEALSRITTLLEPAPTAARAPRAPAAPSTRSRRRVAHVRRWAAPATAAAVLGTLALLLDVGVEFGKTPASADTTETAAIAEIKPPLTPPTAVAEPDREPARSASLSRPVTKSAGRSTRTSPSQPRSVPQRFAWAPTAGASGYHVELFSADTKVYAADTTKPAVTIPARWSFDGTNRTLQPGEYRWYVWPVISGQREGGPIVQARLTVPRR
jgi:hypothetical protein